MIENIEIDKYERMDKNNGDAKLNINPDTECFKRKVYKKGNPQVSRSPKK